MRARLCCLALLPLVAATRIGAGEIPGFTWKGKPNFPGFARGMAAGPDGNLWLTDADANAIGRVVQDGTVTDGYKLGTYTAFPIPTANSFPLAITAGPDGNLWFVEVNHGGKIGRCTTAGVITEFPLPGPSNGFPGIAAGLDGNLWLSASAFDAAHPARIIRVTPEGAATAFPLAAGISVFNLAAGADGNVWFIEKTGTTGGIARITPEGLVTDFWLATNHFPADLTLGPDGAIWFTESSANMIGRITRDGVITEFPVPTANSYPWAIASGVDGNIWFTEYDAHKIGQLVVATATDQGQATFNDSGTWSFYQSVALIPLLPASTGTLVATARRGLPNLNAAADGPHCPGPTFIVRGSSTGNGNAEQIAAAGASTCADLVASQAAAVRQGYCWEFYAKVLNRGPDTARNVILTGQFVAGRPLQLSDPSVHLTTFLGQASASCTTSGNHVTCKIATLDPMVGVEARTHIDAGNDLPCNAIPTEARQVMGGLAIASSDTPDPAPPNNIAIAKYGDAYTFGDSNFHGIWLIGETLEPDPNALHTVEVQKRGTK